MTAAVSGRVLVDVWPSRAIELKAADAFVQTEHMQTNTWISDEEWSVCWFVMLWIFLPQGAIFVCVCVHPLLWVCILSKPGSWCVLCVRRRLYFGGHISPLPSTQGFFHFAFFFNDFICFFCPHIVFFMFLLSLICVTVKCFELFADIKCSCQGWQDWWDGLCSTENCRVGVWLAMGSVVVLCSSTIGCLLVLCRLLLVRPRC